MGNSVFTCATCMDRMKFRQPKSLISNPTNRDRAILTTTEKPIMSSTTRGQNETRRRPTVASHVFTKENAKAAVTLANLNYASDEDSSLDTETDTD